MNALRSRMTLLALFWMMAKVFDLAIVHRPPGDVWNLAYYEIAALLDWIMFYLCRRFTTGKLCRDVEALCIASIVTHALGFALYMAYAPPSVYNWIIQGINYVLALRLTFFGGLDALHNFSNRLGRGLFRRHPVRRSGLATEKAHQ